MTHILRPVLLAGLLAICANSASGTLFLYDSFNYGPSGTSLGTAGAPAWVKNGTSPDPTVQDVGGLTYPGLQVSTDTVSLQYDGSAINNGGAGVPAATDGYTISAGGITTGSVYYSLLMKVTAVQVSILGNGFGTGGNLTGGSFMAGPQTIAAAATPTNPTTAAPLLIRSGDGTQFSTTYQLGTAKTSTPADRTFYTGQSFNAGGDNPDTVFVVLKYTFDAVNGDSAKLFINPTPGSAEPAAQLTVTAGTALTLNTGITSFFVRNNTVEPDAMLIDELRIGDTWQDVTPLAGAGTLGDFNNDGKVDAGDYVTWRKNYHTINALANDNGLGTPIREAHYDLWRANYGKPPGAGSSLGNAAVPEPTAMGLAFMGLAVFVAGRRTR